MLVLQIEAMQYDKGILLSEYLTQKTGGYDRPRLAIEAAKKVLERDNKNNRNAAYAAEAGTYAAYAAAEAVWYDEPKKDIQAKIINYGLSLFKEG